MARLEPIRTANLRLADPRGLDEAEAERLLQARKDGVALNHGIQSDEVASPLTAMERPTTWPPAYDPGTREVLERTVISCCPPRTRTASRR